MWIELFFTILTSKVNPPDSLIWSHRLWFLLLCLELSSVGMRIRNVRIRQFVADLWNFTEFKYSIIETQSHFSSRGKLLLIFQLLSVHSVLSHSPLFLNTSTENGLKRNMSNWEIPLSLFLAHDSLGFLALSLVLKNDFQSLSVLSVVIWHWFFLKKKKSQYPNVWSHRSKLSWQVNSQKRSIDFASVSFMLHNSYVRNRVLCYGLARSKFRVAFFDIKKCFRKMEHFSKSFL